MKTTPNPEDESNGIDPQASKIKGKPRQEINHVNIPAPRLQLIQFKIIGTAPFVQLRFSEKAIHAMATKMQEGSQANKKRVREARDFDADFLGAQHISDEGWNGHPAGAFRNGMISACRLVQFKMTHAKLSCFVEPDGFDKVDGVPLVRIYGTPEPHLMHARNANNSCDLRVRAMFRKWHAVVTVRFDEDQFTPTDVANLMTRLGAQVGIGEGRPDSKDSAGMGWGTFRLG